MLLKVATVLAAVSASATALSAPPRMHNAQSVNLWKLNQQARARDVSSTSSSSQSRLDSVYSSSRTSRGNLNSGLRVQDGIESLDDFYGNIQVEKRATDFPQYNFTQPLDHFFGTTNGTFEQRYWVRFSLSCLFFLHHSFVLTLGEHATLYPEQQ